MAAHAEQAKVMTLARYYWEHGEDSVELVVLCRPCKREWLATGKVVHHAESLDGSEGNRCEGCQAPDEQAVIHLREG